MESKECCNVVASRWDTMRKGFFILMGMMHGSECAPGFL